MILLLYITFFLLVALYSLALFSILGYIVLSGYKKHADKSKDKDEDNPTLWC